MEGGSCEEILLPLIDKASRAMFLLSQDGMEWKYMRFCKMEFRICELNRYGFY